MTATNHVVTGALIGFAIVNPWVALPLALASHFALDSLPHFGEDKEHIRSALKRLKFILPFDMLLAFTVLVAIVVTRPEHWQVAAACGVVAASPDLGQLFFFIRYLRFGEIRFPTNWLYRFHSYIQWGERQWGAWVEVAWFAVFGSLLLARL